MDTNPQDNSFLTCPLRSVSLSQVRVTLGVGRVASPEKPQRLRSMGALTALTALPAQR